MNINEIEHIAFKELWEHALIGLAIVSEDGKFISANPNFCKIVEYAEAELQSKTFQDITHPDDLDADVKMSKRLADDVNDENEYLMKKRYITKTGKVVWVVLKVNRLQRENGEFAYFLSQISELIEVLPPISSPIIPTSKTLSNKLMWTWLKSYSGWLIIVLGSLAIIIAKVIEELNK